MIGPPDGLESPGARREQTADGVSRLFVYGSLLPDGSNAQMLAGLKGIWTRGSVRGRVVTLRTGDAAGYPALIPDDDGSPVPGRVFESPDLPDRWHALDSFEGPSYERVVMSVTLDDGTTTRAFVYARAPSPKPQAPSPKPQALSPKP